MPCNPDALRGGNGGRIMAKTQLVIMAEELLIGMFLRIAKNLGETQALAALHADKMETEALLSYYLNAPKGTLVRGERVWWKRNLTQRLGLFDAIETKIRDGVIDEDPEEDEDEDDEEEVVEEDDEPPIPFINGPWLCWSNPAKVKSVA